MKNFFLMIIITTLGVLCISFATDSTTTTESRFRGMLYTCDGGSETKVWNATSCKPYSLWKEYAMNWCPAGTALSSFSTIDDCSLMVWSSAVAVPPINIPPISETPTLIAIPTITPINIEQPVYTDINFPVADKMLQTFIQKHPDIKEEVSCIGLNYYITKIMKQTEIILGIPDANREAEIKANFKKLLYNYLNDMLACDDNIASTKPEKPTIRFENYFRGISYACDGGSETKIWKETSCKPYSVWKDFAVSQCSTADRLSTFITIDACDSTIVPPIIPPATEKPSVTRAENYFKGISYSCGDGSENQELDENSCQLYSLLKESAVNYCSEKGGLSKFSTIEPCFPTTEEKTESAKLETEMSYKYAMKNGITTQPTLQDANAQGKLTRAHMAKMIVKFAEKVLDKFPDTSKVCIFNDIADQSEELQNYIIKSCQLGLMGQGLVAFHPNDTFTRAQFATTLSRALYGDIYEGGTVYYEGHLKALKDANIINNIDTPLVPETRGYVWMMMQRADEKFNFEKSEEINK